MESKLRERAKALEAKHFGLQLHVHVLPFLRPAPQGKRRSRSEKNGSA
jgi:hypothetical protein